MRKELIQNHFKIIKTNHLIIEAKINNISGNFIIDTGASNSCVDLNKARVFKLKCENSAENAVSATDDINNTFISKNNEITIGKWLKSNLELILFDLTHIQNALNKKTNIEIDGIIGSDILIEGKAIIDYRNKKIGLQF